MKTFTIAANLTGDSYQALIDEMAKTATSFRLVLRDDVGFSKQAQQVIDKLMQHGAISQKRTNSWDSNQVLHQPHKVATLYKFKVNYNTIKILKTRANSLFDWGNTYDANNLPNLPEDLAFYKDNQLLLAASGHERYFHVLFETKADFEQWKAKYFQTPVEWWGD